MSVRSATVRPMRRMLLAVCLLAGCPSEPPPACKMVDTACAHRGTQLSVGWVEGENVRCRYHGWMYDGTGQCVEQPLEDRPFCERIRIKSYAMNPGRNVTLVYRVLF